jgi:hypothetical protein
MKRNEWSRKQFLKQVGGAAVGVTVSQLAIFGSHSTTAPEKTVLTPLSVNGGALKSAFDKASDKPRLLGIFSPTCANCLKVCSDIQDVLSRNPNKDLKVFVLWAPYGERDNIGLAIQAAGAYLPDPRVTHFWDMWRFGSRAFSPKLRVPEAHTWDLILFYDPGITWEEPVPKHASWMQNKNLRTGSPYSQKGFEARFKKWLE